MKVACIQMCSGTSQEKNIATVEKLLGEAAAQGAQYVQTPEMTGILQRDSKALLATIVEQDADPVFAACSALAKKHGIWLHLGSTAVALPDTGETGKAANRGAVFGPDGTLLRTYDKIHMFDVDVDGENKWRESNRYQAGNRAEVVDLAIGESGNAKLGLSICYDMRFAALYRQLAQSGAQILTAPSSFTQPTGEAHWEVLLRARAIENGAFMIAAAQSGDHEDGRKTHGHSIIINPWGEVIGELGRESEGVLVREIDLVEVAKARQRIPSLANGRAFTLSEG